MSVELTGLEQKCREIGKVISYAIEKTYGTQQVGFCLLLFDFGDGGHMSYISNAARADMIESLEELIEHLKKDPTQ